MVEVLHFSAKSILQGISAQQKPDNSHPHIDKADRHLTDETQANTDHYDTNVSNVSSNNSKDASLIPERSNAEPAHDENVSLANHQNLTLDFDAQHRETALHGHRRKG